MSDDFNTGSGASESYPLQCSALRKGGHVLIKGEPCKIVSMSTSKTGKHGHAKVKFIIYFLMVSLFLHFGTDNFDYFKDYFEHG